MDFRGQPSTKMPSWKNTYVDKWHKIFQRINGPPLDLDEYREKAESVVEFYCGKMIKTHVMKYPCKLDDDEFAYRDSFRLLLKEKSVENTILSLQGCNLVVEFGLFHLVFEFITNKTPEEALARLRKNVKELKRDDKIIILVGIDYTAKSKETICSWTTSLYAINGVRTAYVSRRRIRICLRRLPETSIPVTNNEKLIRVEKVLRHLEVIDRTT